MKIAILAFCFILAASSNAIKARDNSSDLLPENIRTHIRSVTEHCSPPMSIPREAIIRGVDLNKDGVPDIVINLGHICDSYCASGGCQHDFWISTPSGGFTLIDELMIVSITRKERSALIVLTHGSRCGRAGMNLCAYRVTVSKGERGALSVWGLNAPPESEKAASAESSDIGPSGKPLDKLQRLIMNIGKAQRNLQERDVQAALEGRGVDPLLRVLKAIELPAVSEDLEGTMYDVSRLHESSVQIVHSNLRKRTLIQYPETNFADEREGGYFNGVYWENGNTILTAGHALPVLDSKPAAVPAHAIDIGLLRVGNRSSLTPDQIIRDSQITDKEIHGAFVVIVGVDPDGTADKKTGRKTYLGIAADLSRGLGQMLARDGSREQMWFGRSFGVMLPPGETKRPAPQQLPNGELYLPPKPIAGMSGSPMYAWLNGRWLFAGVLYASWNANDKHRAVDLGFVHGIETVREGVMRGEIKQIP